MNNVSSSELLPEHAPASGEEAASRADQLARYPDGSERIKCIDELNEMIMLTCGNPLPDNRFTQSQLLWRAFNAGRRYGAEMGLEERTDSDEERGACPGNDQS